MNKYDKEQYPHKELTGKIIKLAFNIYNELGYGLPERVYQKAFKCALSKEKISFTKEAYGKIEFDGEVVGKYFLDFLVDGRVAVEFKVRNEIYKKDVVQLLNYLKAKKIEIGIVLAITRDGIKIKRLVNT